MPGSSFALGIATGMAVSHGGTAFSNSELGYIIFGTVAWCGWFCLGLVILEDNLWGQFFWQAAPFLIAGILLITI